MILKKHVAHDGRLILAICDNSLLGKKFEDENRQLDLTGSFYKGEEMDEEEILSLIKKAYLINLVGEESINVGIKSGIIQKENIIKIDGIPHAEGLVITED